MLVLDCGYCGVRKPLTRRPARTPRNCGAAECRKQWNTDRCRTWQQQYRAKNGEWYMHPSKPPVTCARCDVRIQSGTQGVSLCKACHHPRVAKVDKARRRLARAARGTSGTTAFAAGHCARCGRPFVGKSLIRHCSARCSRADRVAERRARQKGCKITPGRRADIYRRDNVTCQLCFRPVNLEAVVPQPMAPVIDHILPLARGGEHGPDNWQLAHFICNSHKRDIVDFTMEEVLA